MKYIYNQKRNSKIKAIGKWAAFTLILTLVFQIVGIPVLNKIGELIIAGPNL